MIFRESKPDLRLLCQLWLDRVLIRLQGQIYRVKSGIFGQTAKLGQPPCLFHSSINGIK